jgi:hypothetical protein
MSDAESGAATSAASDLGAAACVGTLWGRCDELEEWVESVRGGRRLADDTDSGGRDDGTRGTPTVLAPETREDKVPARRIGEVEEPGVIFLPRVRAASKSSDRGEPDFELPRGLLVASTFAAASALRLSSSSKRPFASGTAPARAAGATGRAAATAAWGLTAAVEVEDTDSTFGRSARFGNSARANAAGTTGLSVAPGTGDPRSPRESTASSPLGCWGGLDLTLSVLWLWLG